MATKWCHNAKTGEIFAYEVDGNPTDFLDETFIDYGNYLTIGFENIKEAEDWAKEWGACRKCKSAGKSDKNGKCHICGGPIEFKPMRII